MTSLAQRLGTVRERIRQSCARCNRQPEEVRLIAASKTRDSDEIRDLQALGVNDFGESRVQEALPKIAALQERAPQWHFIGHLQSNKARQVAARFAWIHAVDSLHLGQRLSEAAVRSGISLNLLLQVNVARDPAKHGLDPDQLYAVVETLLPLPGVELRGLMTIGFQQADPARTRASFAALRGLLEGCRQRFGDGFTELSMGMSDDYTLAIEEGSTMIRLGTALFGARS